MMEKNKIMPCRFCGSDAKLLKLQNDNGDAVYGVFCTKDLESECSHGHYIDNYATAEEAINEWNYGFVSNSCSEDNCYWGTCPFAPKEEPKHEHWILCSERLPEEDYETGEGVQYSDYVLISVEHKGTEVTITDYGYTVDGKWYSAYADCFISQEWKVTAWMQLPEPYRGEE